MVFRGGSLGYADTPLLSLKSEAELDGQQAADGPR
ncbi:hypothetical protein C8J44_2795 [Sphingomonas sp. PP-CE-3A-406]|nr:hypothetical protein C8J44_2795 [Sphingomonas sp. PP-CE-3A-406]